MCSALMLLAGVLRLPLRRVNRLFGEFVRLPLYIGQVRRGFPLPGIDRSRMSLLRDFPQIRFQDGGRQPLVAPREKNIFVEISASML